MRRVNIILDDTASDLLKRYMAIKNSPNIDTAITNIIKNHVADLLE